MKRRNFIKLIGAAISTVCGAPLIMKSVVAKPEYGVFYTKRYTFGWPDPRGNWFVEKTDSELTEDAIDQAIIDIQKFKREREQLGSGYSWQRVSEVGGKIKYRWRMKPSFGLARIKKKGEQSFYTLK